MTVRGIQTSRGSSGRSIILADVSVSHFSGSNYFKYFNVLTLPFFFSITHKNTENSVTNTDTN